MEENKVKKEKIGIIDGLLKGAEKLGFIIDIKKYDRPFFEDDTEALKSDWEEIGKDMYKVFDEYEKKDHCF